MRTLLKSIVLCILMVGVVCYTSQADALCFSTYAESYVPQSRPPESFIDSASSSSPGEISSYVEGYVWYGEPFPPLTPLYYLGHAQACAHSDGHLQVGAAYPGGWDFRGDFLAAANWSKTYKNYSSETQPYYLNLSISEVEFWLSGKVTDADISYAIDISSDLTGNIFYSAAEGIVSIYPEEPYEVPNVFGTDLGGWDGRFFDPYENRFYLGTLAPGEEITIFCNIEASLSGFEYVEVASVADLYLEVVVPEPATMLLLGSGLVGLAAFRKKFRKEISI